MYLAGICSKSLTLVKQHRATDPQYAASVSAFREWTASALQTRMEFSDTIVEITPEEFQDPTWQETTMVCGSQHVPAGNLPTFSLGRAQGSSLQAAHLAHRVTYEHGAEGHNTAGTAGMYEGQGAHQKAQQPNSTPLINHIHVCCLMWNTLNAFCFSVAAFPHLPRWPPLASHCLWLSATRGAGIKKGLCHRRTRSSRKTWVPASRSIIFHTRGTRNTPCTDMRHLTFGFHTHT